MDNQSQNHNTMQEPSTKKEEPPHEDVDFRMFLYEIRKLKSVSKETIYKSRFLTNEEKTEIIKELFLTYNYLLTHYEQRTSY
jgi:hypothetical protein